MTNETQTDHPISVKPLPSMMSLCLSIPPYEIINLDDSHNPDLAEIYWYRGQLDSYCPECGKESVFHAANKSWSSEVGIVDTRKVFTHKFLCTRNNQHSLCFTFRIGDKTLTKIGQYPSLADLAQPSISKYRAVLSRPQFNELSKAVGLAAHGVGIGSFVYLRRIFEFLIDEAHKQISEDPDWQEEIYLRARMSEKIVLLRSKLPKFLVENKSLYGILSKGIHELTEQECLDAFPITLTGIELILDELIVQKERESKIRQASNMMNKLKQDLADNTDGSDL